MAEQPLNAFGMVLHRRSQSTGDESRLKPGWCGRSAASQFWADERGKKKSSLCTGTVIQLYKCILSTFQDVFAHFLQPSGRLIAHRRW